MAHSFIPKITFPTRLTETPSILIDNLFCKLTLHITDIKPDIFIKLFSDHQPYFIVTNLVTTRVPQPKYITIREQDEHSLSKVNTKLMNSNLMTKMDLTLLSDPNPNYNILESDIINANNKFTAIKIVKFSKYKYKINNWITHRIIKQFNTRRNDSRKTINDLLSNRKEKTSPTHFKDKQVIVTDKLEIANKLNLYITNIGSNLAKLGVRSLANAIVELGSFKRGK